MKRTVSVALAVLWVVGPHEGLRAEGHRWLRELDLSTSVASGGVTTALSYVTSVGLWGERVWLGLGPRLSGFYGGTGQRLTTADSQLISDGPVNELTVSDLGSFALNLELSARLRPVARLELGLNLDVLGVGFGVGRSGEYRATDPQFEGAQSVSTSRLNAFLFGQRDRGSLNSEFYAAWQFGGGWTVRGGVTHYLVEVTTERALDGGNDRFRRFYTMPFLAGGVRW
jgi:hypothetical protein